MCVAGSAVGPVALNRSTWNHGVLGPVGLPLHTLARRPQFKGLTDTGLVASIHPATNLTADQNARYGTTHRRHRPASDFADLLAQERAGDAAKHLGDRSAVTYVEVAAGKWR